MSNRDKNSSSALRGCFVQTNNELSRSVKKVREFFDALPEQNRRVNFYLAKRGWYLSGRLAPVDIKAMDKLVANKRHVALKRQLVKCGDRHLKDIQHHVCLYWPLRAPIIMDEFEAHRVRKYSLSIPTMLSQADGMSLELMGVNFFSKEEKRPKTAKAYKGKIKRKPVEGSLSDLFFLQPLELLFSMSVDTRVRDKKRKKDRWFGPLNRHGVLHGIDLGYANKENSLRVVFLLDYLTDLKRHYF